MVTSRKHSTPSRSRGTKADWTWLIYMAGDNDLESSGQGDLRELKRVGSTDRVQVIVQFDTEDRGMTRFRVGKGSLTPLERVPGVNMGSAKTLAEFVSWGLARYPAERVLLDLWNHGGGWENLGPDFDYEEFRSAKPRRAMRLQRLRRAFFKSTISTIHARARKTRAICIDTGSHDYLDNQELRRAIGTGLGGRSRVDLVGMDACLMNMLEVGYELRGVAGVMVGSEETEPPAGWPYAAILRRLVKDPGIGAKDLASIVVEEYGRYYRHAGESATQSALDLGHIDRIAMVVDALAGELLPLVKAKDGVALGQVMVARNRALHFEDSPEYVDLADLCRQLQERMPSTDGVCAAAQVVLDAVATDPKGGFVLANAATSRSVARAGGVSIYFPAARDQNAPDYAKLQFSKATRWNELLDAVSGD